MPGTSLISGATRTTVRGAELVLTLRQKLHSGGIWFHLAALVLATCIFFTCHDRATALQYGNNIAFVVDRCAGGYDCRDVVLCPSSGFLGQLAA